MNLQEQLYRDEGVRLTPYLDTVGKLTIGVGRNLTDVGISEAEATYLLENDIAKITAQLNSRLPWFAAIGEVRQAVIVNMGFNLGFNGLETFAQMLAAMAQGNWSVAAQEMLESKWAKQVGDRAHRLAQQLLSDQWV